MDPARDTDPKIMCVDYSRYRAVYKACPARLNISDCDQANCETYLELRGVRVNISSPIPGIVRYVSNMTTVPRYTYWACGTAVFGANDLGGHVAGLWRAGSRYARSFSFLLTFVTSSKSWMY